MFLTNFLPSPHSDRFLTCGDNNCPYDNLCLAQLAGFTESQCCQVPFPGSCDLSFDPHVCGSAQCEYTNLCIALASGYTEEQCMPKTSGPPTRSPTRSPTRLPTKTPTKMPTKQPTPGKFQFSYWSFAFVVLFSHKSFLPKQTKQN